MAKTKSADAGGDKAEKAKKSPARSGGKAKSSAKPAPAALAPQIDTALAAETAAKLVGAKFGGAATAGAGEGRESAAFRNLKQQLNPPASSALSNLLDKTGGPGQRRPNLPAFGGPGGGPAVGRNQRFSADVNRAGVPRRTGG